MPGRTQPAEGRISLVVFQVADQVCALPREAVEHILPMPRLARPPGLPAPLQGFLDLAGHPVPVLALDRLFGLADGADSAEVEAARHLLAMRGGALALRVDRALDVAVVERAALQPVSGTLTLNGCVQAEWRRAGGTPVHLLAADRLLSDEERLRLEALALRQAERLSMWGSGSDDVEGAA